KAFTKSAWEKRWIQGVFVAAIVMAITHWGQNWVMSVVNATNQSWPEVFRFVLLTSMGAGSLSPTTYVLAATVAFISGIVLSWIYYRTDKNWQPEKFKIAFALVVWPMFATMLLMGLMPITMLIVSLGPIVIMMASVMLFRLNFE